jgi:hypothetical protein
MTIREFLYRRWRLPTFTALAFFALFVTAALVGDGDQVLWVYVALPSVLVFFVALNVQFFTMRCPRCKVRLSVNGIWRGLTSKGKSSRFNYCPGCGTSLETQA